jgi:citrate synthase
MSIDYVPGLAGVPAARSKIGFVDGKAGELFYRGYPVADLAESATFEEVTYLLLFGALPTRAELVELTAALAARRRLDDATLATLRSLPSSGHPMAALIAGVAAAGMSAPEETDRAGAALDLIAKVPAIVAAFHRLRSGKDPVVAPAGLGHAAAFLYQLDGKEPDPLVARAMDVALILHAEHGFNASTFAARVTGSTLANPYHVIATAVATLAGPLHGGANEQVLHTLRAIPAGTPPRQWAEEQLAARAKISGFGHRVYKVKDPRATILQKLAAEVFARFGSTSLYETATALEEAMAELVGAKGIYPNVDFYSGIVYEKLAIPLDLFTPIFAIARSAGWLAHWIEQIEDNRIFRPTQVYEGDRGLTFVPIDDR